MRNLALVLVPFIASVLVGCGRDTVGSSEIAPSPASGGGVSDNIDRSYVLTFSENSGGVSLSAQFTMSGTWSTTVRLDPPASVSVDGQSLHQAASLSEGGAVLLGTFLPILSPLFWAASGTSYTADLPGSYSAVRTVHFVDQQGKSFDDRIRVYSLLPVNLPSTISLSAGAAATVSGESAPGTSNYAMSLKQVKADGTTASAYASDSSGNIRIRAEDLRDFQPGMAELKVERSVQVPLNQVGGGSATASLIYQSRIYQVSVQ